jgi:hypothetical protein
MLEEGMVLHADRPPSTQAARVQRTSLNDEWIAVVFFMVSLR